MDPILDLGSFPSKLDLSEVNLSPLHPRFCLCWSIASRKVFFRGTQSGKQTLLSRHSTLQLLFLLIFLAFVPAWFPFLLLSAHISVPLPLVVLFGFVAFPPESFLMHASQLCSDGPVPGLLYPSEV